MERNNFQDEGSSRFIDRSNQQAVSTSYAPPSGTVPISRRAPPAQFVRNNTVPSISPQNQIDSISPTGSVAMNDARLADRPPKRRRADDSPSSSSRQSASASRPDQHPLDSVAVLEAGSQSASQASASDLLSQLHPKAPRRKWQQRRLLQQNPGPDEKEAVSVFSIDESGKIGEKIAIDVVYEDKLQHSILSSSVVRCLGMDSEELPDGPRAFFTNSSGFVRPKEYVEVAMEQVDMNSGHRRKSQLGAMLVVDAARFKPGIHAVLRRDFFERASLMPSRLQQNRRQPRQPNRPRFEQPAASSSQSNQLMGGFIGNLILRSATNSMGQSFGDEPRSLSNYPHYGPYASNPMLGIPPNPRHQGYPTSSIEMHGNIPQYMHPQMLGPNPITDALFVDPNLMMYGDDQSPTGNCWPPSGPGPSFQ